MVRVTSEGEVTPALFCALPDTVTALSAELTELSTAVIVTVPVLVVAPAAIVSTGLLLNVKSPATAFAPGVAETVIVVAAVDARVKVAVTVV